MNVEIDFFFFFSRVTGTRKANATDFIKICKSFSIQEGNDFQCAFYCYVC